jgi:hypothetical protein
MFSVGPIDNINLLLISTDRSHVSLLYTYGWYNIWMYKIQLVVIIKCKSIYKEVEYFFKTETQNRVQVF